MKKMISTALGALLVALFVVVGLALPGSASAEPTADCKSVKVELADRDDTGTGGHVWAKDTMTRTLKVCVEAAQPAAPAASESTWKYSATLTDSGTFVTQEGKTPRGNAGLPGGVKGTVNGGYVSTVFTAPAWDENFKLKAPDAKTSSSNWVSEAFPDSAGATIATYKWTYKTDCESYTDNDGQYEGDITSKCVKTEAPTVTEPTCTANGKLNLPTTEGVKYTAIRQGDHKVTVLATAEEGYILVGDKEWTVKVLPMLTGDACQSPSPSPSPSQSTGSPSPAPTSTSTATPSESSEVIVPVGNNTDDQGNLPVTGSKVPMGYIVGSAAVLVAAGLGLILAVRRRNNPETEAA